LTYRLNGEKRNALCLGRAQRGARFQREGRKDRQEEERGQELDPSKSTHRTGRGEDHREGKGEVRRDIIGRKGGKEGKSVKSH